MSARREQLLRLLDFVTGRLAEGDVAGSVWVLCDELRALCQESPRDEWLEELAPACRRHPLHGLLLEDPYTRRAFDKPRGYAGDAEMLDYVYLGSPPTDTTDLGREVFRVTTGGPNGRSVLARRDLLAAQIDAAAARQERPAILSVGCGHLREAQLARSVKRGWAGVLYALDQDERSLAVVAGEQGDCGVVPSHCRVQTLLRGQRRFSGLALVYVSGLFDYLSLELAARLTRSLFDMLGPGGRLLTANFTPDSNGRGYMEAIMDWKLIYRDEADMEALARAIPPGQVARQTVYREGNRNIVFLEMDRAN